MINIRKLTYCKSKLFCILSLFYALLYFSFIVIRGGITRYGLSNALDVFKREPAVARFAHFLPQMTNPCYLYEHEHELFDQLTDKNNAHRHSPYRKTKARFVYNDGFSNDTHILRCLPYYFVLGWPKCGTTDLYAKMMVHPHILKPRKKEPMYFNKRRFDAIFRRSEDALTYLAGMADHSPGRKLAYMLSRNRSTHIKYIFGDHSTHTIDMWYGHKTEWKPKYSFEAFPQNTKDIPLVHSLSNAQLIKRLLPDAKFIITIRDPVERFYSLYKMHEATSPEDFHAGVVNGIRWWNACISEKFPIGSCMYEKVLPKSFEAVACTWLLRAIASARRSIYYLYIQEWLDVFPRNQFLFLRFEDYAKDEVQTINNKIFPFLGLSKLSKHEQSVMSKLKRPKTTSRRKNSAGKKINPSYKLPMLEQTRTLLRDFYRPYNAKLADLLNDEGYMWDY